MAEWSKAPDSSSGLRERAWVQIPLLTIFIYFFVLFLFGRLNKNIVRYTLVPLVISTIILR
ncbi:transmembrane protein, putative [Medicago truncatula]|uniref:Transmembrane protein, putative n=1 Tax=Medicago truncatula TaxID=3880 RepID=G7K7B1_MEDTR|nr:transmembrane protein, putative [Medicago truncatula]